MPYPGDSGFTQWHDAMKMVARLPGGIPPEFRRRLWLTLAEKHLQARGVDWTHAERFCFNEWSNPDDEELGVQIVKDLHRTGCSLFCGAAAEENQALLKRVLLAFARWNKAVGYCQGFNMLAALILQVMDRSECDAVKVMIYLIEGVLPESYFANNLRGLSVDMAVFRDLLRLRLPALSQHLEQLQHDARDSATGTSYEPPLTNVFTMQWFLTLFSNCLPQPTVLRVWDLIFLEGNEVLLRTALAIWDGLADRIMAVDSADEFYSIMGVLTREMLEFGLMDTNNLIKTIVTIAPFPFPELPELRDKYLYNITPWTHTVSTAARRGLRLFYSDDDDEGTDEDDEKIAVAAAYGIFRSPRRRDSINRAPSPSSTLSAINYAPDRDRLALDISALKQQYTKLKERQRQAHIILTAACARQPLGPSAPNPVAMNHLLLGKSALLSVRGRRGGPPPGAVPPPANIALRSAPHQHKAKPPEQTITSPTVEVVAPQKQQTLHWKDTKKKQHRSLQQVENDAKETPGDIPIIVEPEAESSSSNSSSSSSSSSSSTSTELCDEPDRLSDFDSEEHSDTSSYLAVSADQTASKMQSPDSAPILSPLEEDTPLPEQNVSEDISDSSELPTTQCLESVLPAVEENVLPSECLQSVPSSSANVTFSKDKDVVPKTDISVSCDNAVTAVQSSPTEVFPARCSLTLPTSPMSKAVASVSLTSPLKTDSSSGPSITNISSPIYSTNALNNQQNVVFPTSLRTDITPSAILTLPVSASSASSSTSSPMSPCKSISPSSPKSDTAPSFPQKDSSLSPIEIPRISPLQEHPTVCRSSPDLSLTPLQSKSPIIEKPFVLTPSPVISLPHSPSRDFPADALVLVSFPELTTAADAPSDLLVPLEPDHETSALETISANTVITSALQTSTFEQNEQEVIVSSPSYHSPIDVFSSSEKIANPGPPFYTPDPKYQISVSPSSHLDISQILSDSDMHKQSEIMSESNHNVVQKSKAENSDIGTKVELDASVLNDHVDVLRLLELNQRLHEHVRGIRDVAQDQNISDEKLESLHDKDVEKLVEMDQQLRSGRRNSERALQIIQENSEILQRILQCQARRPSRLSEEESNGGTLPSDSGSNVPSVPSSSSTENVDVVASQALESQENESALESSRTLSPVVDHTVIDRSSSLINGIGDETGIPFSSRVPESVELFTYSKTITEATKDDVNKSSESKSKTVDSNKLFTYASPGPQSISSHENNKMEIKEKKTSTSVKEMSTTSLDNNLFEKSAFRLNDDDLSVPTTYRTSTALSRVSRFSAEDSSNNDPLDEKYSTYLARQRSNLSDVSPDMKALRKDKELEEEYKTFRSSISVKKDFADKDISKYEPLGTSWLHERESKSDYSKDDNFLTRSPYSTYKYSSDFPKSYDRISGCDYSSSLSSGTRSYGREFGKESFEYSSRTYRDYSSPRISKDAFTHLPSIENEKGLSDDIYSSPRRRYYDHSDGTRKTRPHSTIISDLSNSEILNRSYSSSSIDRYLPKSKRSATTTNIDDDDDDLKSYIGRSYSPIYESESSSKEKGLSKSSFLDDFTSSSKDVSPSAYRSDKQDSESSITPLSPGASPKKSKDIHISFPPIKSSSFGSPTRTSSSKFDPFPPRPSTRQPKELGVRLGLYSSTELGKKT